MAVRIFKHLKYKASKRSYYQLLLDQMGLSVLDKRHAQNLFFYSKLRLDSIASLILIWPWILWDLQI